MELLWLVLCVCLPDGSHVQAHFGVVAARPMVYDVAASNRARGDTFLHVHTARTCHVL